MNSEIEAFPFPSCLREYDGFVDLSADERREFEKLLQFFSDLGTELHSDERKDDAEGFFDFIDNLELDLAVRIGSHAHSRSSFSSWLIHSSWAFDVEGEMVSSLDEDLIELIDSQGPRIKESIPNLEAWFRAVGAGLVKATAGISGAKTLSDAIAHQIAVDSLVMKLLVCCYKCRLNPVVVATR